MSKITEFKEDVAWILEGEGAVVKGDSKYEISAKGFAAAKSEIEKKFVVRSSKKTDGLFAIMVVNKKGDKQELLATVMVKKKPAAKEAGEKKKATSNIREPLYVRSKMLNDAGHDNHMADITVIAKDPKKLFDVFFEELNKLLDSSDVCEEAKHEKFKKLENGDLYTKILFPKIAGKSTAAYQGYCKAMTAAKANAKEIVSGKKKAAKKSEDEDW